MTLYVREYKSLGNAGNAQAPQEPAITDQIVAPGASSAPFNANTTYVRIQSDAVCSFKFGPTGTTAATTNARLPANATEYFFVTPGLVVATVANT